MSSLHRMGIHTYAQGQVLADIGFDDDAARDAMRTHLPVAEEIERDDVSMLLRVLPLLDDGEPIGAVILIRDVSDLRRRDRMLLSKDATIREIHHRVKNNLQTIASLLRLQARRLQSPEARAALAESERRIRSIAIVHETLSREPGDVVHFDEIVRPLARLVEDTASSPELQIRFSVDGDAGDLPGEVATPLAVVLNELMQNAVDHAFPEGTSEARRCRCCSGGTAITWSIEVVDNGAGLPEGFSLEGGQGLGLVDRAGARDRRARWLDRDAQRRRHRRCACGSRVAMPEWNSTSRAVTSNGAAECDRGQPTWTSELVADHDLRSRRRSSSVRPPHTPASWLVRERELEALRRSPDTARRPAWRPRSGRAPPPVVPIGKNSSGRGVATGGAVSATPPCPSRASGSRSAPLRVPLRWVAQTLGCDLVFDLMRPSHKRSCAPAHKRVRFPLPGFPQRDSAG